MSGGGDEALQTARRCFEAWDRRDLEALLDQYADDAEVDASRISDGIYRGKDAVRAFYAEIFASTTFTNEDIEYATDENRVLATTLITGSGARSGAPMEGAFGYLFTVEGGVVRRVVFYPDANEGRAALGSSGADG